MDNRELPTYYGFILIKRTNGLICGRYPVTKKECIIGRSNNCDIRILLENVSAEHCVLLYVDNKAYIRDKSIVGSTKVNGKNVGRNNFLLRNEDEIEICGRRFVWIYAKSCVEMNNSGRKSGIRHGYTTPSVLERSSNHVNTPLDNNKMSLNPVKSSTKTPSKTLISINKTPIVVAATNMSRSSFDELKNSLKKQNSTANSHSEFQLAKSFSGRNIPLIEDCKTIPRKSWVVTSSTSIDSTSSGAHLLNKLSSDRMKRDFTPEFNASYHYKDENVEFDSPELLNVVSNDISVNKQNEGLNSDLLIDNPSVSVSDINNSQFSNIQKNVLLSSEPNPSTSRRDTYFIDDGPIVTEQNITPAPRRSILKCSKTTKPNRSRSSCRMVQFARLPKSDSRINKISKSRFNSGSNFLVTSNEVNEDHNQLMNSNVEEYDDDLDGVQPLDSSVASLIVSPILDNSGVNKSIKRGSRGNKVMSLINSFEKRSNELPKHSIRASDLLSLSGSKYGDTMPENDSINNSNLLQESLSSLRRINLENIFVSEDSSKNISCDCENEPTLQNINNSVQNVEMFSNSVKTSLNITETENKSVNIPKKDLPENASNCEYNFASPLNIHPQTNSSIITETSVSEDQPIFVDPENVEITTNNSVETVNNQLNDSYIIKSVSKTTANKYSNMFDNVDNEIEKTNDSQGCEKICTNEDERLDIYKLVEKETIEVRNDVLENAKESICVESNQSEVQNNVSKSESDEESPSKVVECMSKMLNTSVDELEITLPQQTETTNESFILVEKDDLLKLLKKNKTNKSVCSTTATSTKNLNNSFTKSAMVQLDTNDSNIYSQSNDLNTILTDQFSTANNDETITSYIIPEKAETENPILQTYIHSKKSSTTVSTIESVIYINSSTSMKNNIDKNDSNNVEISTRTKEIEPSIVQKSNLNSTAITIDDSTCRVIPIDSLEKVPSSNVKIDETNSKHTLNVTNLKQLDKSIQSMVNASTVHNDKRSTRSSKQIIEMNVSSDIDLMEKNENMLKSFNNLEHTSFTTADTSIGKPRYESTPWTSSKSSKTPKHSTTSEISNKTPHNESDNMGRQKRRNRSISPFPEPEIWAQMMKDFNASVKKASVSQNNTIDISNCSKILFNQESRSNEIAIKLTKEESPLNCTNVINNTSNIQKESTIQHSLKSSYPSSKTKKSSNESDLGKRSTRGSSKSLTKTCNMSRSKNNNIQLNNTVDGLKKNNTSSEVLKKKPSTSPQPLKTLSTKNKKTNLETSTNTVPDLKHSTSTTEHDNNSDSSSSKSLLVSNKTRKFTRKVKTNSSPVLLSPPRRNLRDRVNKNVSAKKQTKVNKITSNELTTSSDTEMSPSTSKSANGSRSSKRKLRNNEELKSPVQKCTTSVSFKTNSRKLRGNIKLNESTLPAKRNITRKNTSLTKKSSPPKSDKKNKTSSPVKTKSTNVGKKTKTKKPQLQPTKTSLNNSSEDESISERENNSQKPQLAETNKEKIKKNDIERIKRGKDESLDVLLQVSKRGRKRAAETPISQPNPKGSKRDISSKVASTTISRCSNSPPKHSSSEIKLVETINSKDSSLVSTRVTRQDKQKNYKKAQAKKRGMNSEDSSDSTLSTRKITRNNTQVINCEIKSEDFDSVPSVRKATRNYVQAKNSSDSAPSELSRKITRNNVLAKKAEINSEDSSDSAPSTRKITRNNVQTKNSLNSIPSARITTRNKVQAKITKINSEDSSDSAPSTQKMTRKVTAKDKEIEINKSNTTSKMKVQNTDAKESKTRTQEKIDMNVVKKSNSTKPKRRGNTKQTIPQDNKESSLPSPRVLRVREKKK